MVDSTPTSRGATTRKYTELYSHSYPQRTAQYEYSRCMVHDGFTLTDVNFGVVRITASPGCDEISVTGEQVPDCSLRRTNAKPDRPDVPIGTRNGEGLAITLSGQTGSVNPGPGKYTRGSYRVDALCGGSSYRFEPSSSTASRLTMNGAVLGEILVNERWPEQATWDHMARAQDVAVGYLLAASFGAGARRMLGLVLEGLFNTESAPPI